MSVVDTASNTALHTVFILSVLGAVDCVPMKLKVKVLGKLKVKILDGETETCANQLN